MASLPDGGWQPLHSLAPTFIWTEAVYASSAIMRYSVLLLALLVLVASCFALRATSGTHKLSARGKVAANIDSHSLPLHQGEGLEQSRTKKFSNALGIDLHLNATWTNSTLQTTLCSNILTIGATLVGEVVLSFPYGDHMEPLLIPDCFWTLSAVTTVSLENVILAGTNQSIIGGSADPLIRLPSTVRTLELYSARLINPMDGGTSYKLSWSSLLTSKPLLKKLVLDNVRLEGTVPTRIPTLLRTLIISGNPLFTGEISGDLFSDYALSSDSIHVSFPLNGLNGTIPSILLTNLNNKGMSSLFFSVAGNAISGTIPGQLFYPTLFPACYRGTFDFSNNSITGTLPYRVLPSGAWGANYAYELNLSDNRLSGTVPDDILDGSPAKMSTLKLDLSGNMLNGSIPAIFTQVTPIFTVVDATVLFARNQLSGAIVATSLWPIASVAAQTVKLDFSSNLLSGTVPVDLLSSAPSPLRLISLLLSNNSLTGTINPTLISGTNFSQPIDLTLSFANNLLTGHLDTALIAAGSTKTSSFQLNLASNALGGTIPNDLFSSYANLSPGFVTLWLFIDNCTLSGALPAIAPKVRYFKLSADNNNLNAIPNASWSVFLTAAFESISSELLLSAANNSFSGELSLPSLSPSLTVSLNLYGSNFSNLAIGSNTRYLRALNVGLNAHLNGTIPSTWLDVDSNVATLVANYTALTGAFPDVSGILNEELELLDLSHTAIDFCAANWTAPWDGYNLFFCDLRSTNAHGCINYYPIECNWNDTSIPSAPIGGTPSPSSSPASGPSSSPTTPSSPSPSPLSMPDAPSGTLNPSIVPSDSNSLRLSLTVLAIAIMVVFMSL